MDLYEIKQFLGLEFDDIYDDDLIQSLWDAAIIYIQNGTGLTYDYNTETPNKLFNLAIKILVTHWYKNREAISEKKVERIPHSLDAIMLQLEYCSGV